MTCSAPGCTRQTKARGLCMTHWKRLRRHGSPDIVLRRGPKPHPTKPRAARKPVVMCAYPGCQKHRRNRAGYCDDHTPGTYITWNSMRGRCNNPRNPAYQRYAGRGISVDPRWNDYAAFLEDMGERPVGCVLHRKDHDGNYTKSNCAWVTKAEHRAIHNRLGRWHLGRTKRARSVAA